MNIALDEIIIDPEFRALIPPLTEDEQKLLEDNIVRDGCREPLTVWHTPEGKYVLLDGHNRVEIIKRHGSWIKYSVWPVVLPDRDAAADWIDANQLGRRNLSPDQMALIRGRRYNRLKGNREANLQQNAPKDQIDTSGETAPAEPKVSTAVKLAEQHGVSPATIKRDGALASAVEKLKTIDAKIEQKVVSGKGPTRGAITKAAAIVELSPKAAKNILRQSVNRRINHLAKKVRPKSPKMNNGISLANEAIDVLKRIPHDDEFRRRAGEIVMDWIKVNMVGGDE